MYLAEDVDPETKEAIGKEAVVWVNAQCDDDLENCDVAASSTPGGPFHSHVISSFFNFSRPIGKLVKAEPKLACIRCGILVLTPFCTLYTHDRAT